MTERAQTVEEREPVWLEQLRQYEQKLAELKEVGIDGVILAMPLDVNRARGSKRRRLQWQRRVLDDLLPDSVVNDAPEKTTLRIVDRLTTRIKTKRSMGEALEGRLAPLAPLFNLQTRGGRTPMPVAFHVIAAKSPKRVVSAKSFTENTFTLLCRDAQGRLDEGLVSRFIEQFRRAPSELDLAQQALIEQLMPGWEPGQAPSFAAPDPRPEPPFAPWIGEHFREDLRTLLAARLPAAEFFHHANQVIALHMGLLQLRLATALNPAMEALEAEVREAGSQSVEAARAAEEDAEAFVGRFWCRAPDPDGARPVGRRSRVRESYRQMERELGALHFDLMLLHRVREVTRAYLEQRLGIEDEDALRELTQRPSQLIGRLQVDAGFRRYFERACMTLAARFIVDQLPEPQWEWGWRTLCGAPTGLWALRRLHERYNADTGRKGQTRSHKTGAQVSRGLLSQGEYGLIQTRQGVGSYFELGVGALPLMLLLVIGSDQEKLRVGGFWRRLERYGLRFAPAERERLLGRLKSMGLYERFSDAGEASYVRNLMVFEGGRV